MDALPNRRAGSRLRWPLALLLLGLLATVTVQLAAATHWHGVGMPVATADHSVPRAPAGDGDRDGCLLCQVVAHVSVSAPPPAPWALVHATETGTISTHAALRGIPITRSSHAWQGRAPPLI